MFSHIAFVLLKHTACGIIDISLLTIALLYLCPFFIQATPHIAGIAALLWSHFPECTNNQIRNAILHAAIEPPDTSAQNPAGWDIFYGHGNVNAGATYNLLKDRGCVGAGGRFPDTDNGEVLSDQSPGGELQLQFGCTSDDHCQEAVPNTCLGVQTCDLDTNTCFESSPPIDCDDGLACTVDSCDPTNGQCAHTAIVCDDNDVCNGIFSCDNSTGCVVDSAPIVCELETECNLASCDALSGECSYNTRVCDDSNACTTDTCDDNLGCVFTPVPACCGNGICEIEVGETDESCAIDCGAPIGGAPTVLEFFPWHEGKRIFIPVLYCKAQLFFFLHLLIHSLTLFNRPHLRELGPAHGKSL